VFRVVYVTSLYFLIPQPAVSTDTKLPAESKKSIPTQRQLKDEYEDLTSIADREIEGVRYSDNESGGKSSIAPIARRAVRFVATPCEACRACFDGLNHGHHIEPAITQVYAFPVKFPAQVQQG
jgi:hypothetical protein